MVIVTVSAAWAVCKKKQMIFFVIFVYIGAYVIMRCENVEIEIIKKSKNKIHIIRI